ncbi:amidase domain-containing protein [Paenarthrobacter sp. NyZ202]|uniref:amidase domain-containing protein n=1 Tax=Paenarthrobacter sp. NyZ202 TaxID=3402689 RepID=UPI003CEC228B
MVNYARYWAFGRNGAYRQFGNDCQNFVSQSLNAGGWQHVGGWGGSAAALRALPARGTPCLSTPSGRPVGGWVGC